jgi:hypothetical protein
VNDTNRRYYDAHAPQPPAFLSRSEQRRLELQPGAIETVDAIKRERDALKAENARLREALTAILKPTGKSVYPALEHVRSLARAGLSAPATPAATTRGDAKEGG